MTKLGKAIEKKRIYIGLLIAEAIIFFIAAIAILRSAEVSIKYDENLLSGLWDEERKELITPDAKIPAGIYDITIDYRSDSAIQTGILYKHASRKTVYEDQPTLSPYSQSVTYSIWVNDACEDFDVRLKDTAEELATLRVKGI